MDGSGGSLVLFFGRSWLNNFNRNSIVHRLCHDLLLSKLQNKTTIAQLFPVIWTLCESVLKEALATGYQPSIWEVVDAAALHLWHPEARHTKSIEWITTFSNIARVSVFLTVVGRYKYYTVGIQHCFEDVL